MSDLIDRRAAIGVLCGCTEHKGRILFDNAVKGINKLPPAQPEIVRCKDCLMHGVCRFERGLGLDGYCSQAERRTDE